MPKCVLKRFENNSKRFYYYDVRKGIIGSNGYAKSINTVLGYYSQETEDYLRDYIETPFSELLCQIDKIDFDALPFSVPPETDALVKRFVYALISRSPQMIDELNKQSYFFKYLSTAKPTQYCSFRRNSFSRETQYSGRLFCDLCGQHNANAIHPSNVRII